MQIRSAVRDREVRRLGRPLHKSTPARAGSYKPRPRWPGSRDCHRWQAMDAACAHSWRSAAGTVSEKALPERAMHPSKFAFLSKERRGKRATPAPMAQNGRVKVRGFILQASYRVASGADGRRVPVVHLYGRLETGGTFLVRDDRQRPHFYIRAADAERARALGAGTEADRKAHVRRRAGMPDRSRHSFRRPRSQGSAARGRHRHVRGRRAFRRSLSDRARHQGRLRDRRRGERRERRQLGVRQSVATTRGREGRAARAVVRHRNRRQGRAAAGDFHVRPRHR